MTTSDESIKAAAEERSKHALASPHHLRSGAVGVFELYGNCLAAIAPVASMLFNVPVMASQAGAATPLVFLLSGVGVLLLACSVIYFSSRFVSAGAFYTWVRQSLGPHMGFRTGWLILGIYSLFEISLQANVGGSLDNILSSLGFHLPLGWLGYAVILTGIVFVLSLLDVQLASWIMAVFSLLELVSLLLLNSAITLKGGVAGHDLLHTFTPAGATLEAVTPGGLAGICLAMSFAFLAFMGFETGVAYGEETRHPRRKMLVVLSSLLLALTLLYSWTAYAATIGIGWQQAGTVLGNVANAPLQYVTLATTFVGAWLGQLLSALVISSNFASACAMHQVQTRYLFAMGREEILPSFFGRTHSRWKSPYAAGIAQSLFTVCVLSVLGCFLMQHTNPDGSIVYALGLPDGTQWTQTNGIVIFQWLSTIVSISIVIVYIFTNIAMPYEAWRRKELRWWKHVLPVVLSCTLLLLPLLSQTLPSLPILASFLTPLGLSPAPFPQIILPLAVVSWMVLGEGYKWWLLKRYPERIEGLGHILQEA
ncbi:amino acid permease [Reticulibacter mediterranei]|uniref:Amino acid permease n=1 Tax=Reticulibacter mediterranei TaxID=2778369 RepID=A0A8J3IU10_9CHLR|nr:APC family permease [Reticulibacter mediterranei]GHP00579.1 amino acid permease [Reticulibacter mediterranei]